MIIMLIIAAIVFALGLYPRAHAAAGREGAIDAPNERGRAR